MVVLKPFCSTKGHVAIELADKVVGKAGRVAHIVPSARPFVGALWSALAAAKAADRAGAREAPPGRAACIIFTAGACWLRALIQSEEDILPLKRIVSASRPTPASPSGWSAQFDASPWGGGGILRSPEKIEQCFHLDWDEDSVRRLGITIGESKWQTFWELLTCLL